MVELIGAVAVADDGATGRGGGLPRPSIRADRRQYRDRIADGPTRNVGASGGERPEMNTDGPPPAVADHLADNRAELFDCVAALVGFDTQSPPGRTAESITSRVPAIGPQHSPHPTAPSGVSMRTRQYSRASIHFCAFATPSPSSRRSGTASIDRISIPPGRVPDP
ncbi:hypothetical protein GCM10008995_23980 [Halobellus salinus]|uniref:Uncharacterized protein n=1 Tax=Halobellus salinus TaxID=931585 RepID=A0A830EK64_9EURY|nr:hypothetical protein [Halobellus salinus]GGJ13350.1 hypothetical protein GCM10008995_23980 [Halobellus salinus]SMP15675.1 hypothetical protein SAMN06265347_105168 [Halobellus salinus]